MLRKNYKGFISEKKDKRITTFRDGIYMGAEPNRIIDPDIDLIAKRKEQICCVCGYRNPEDHDDLLCYMGKWLCLGCFKQFEEQIPKKEENDNSGSISILLKTFLPDDLKKEMKIQMEDAADQVRANFLLIKHGMEDLVNKGFSLKEAKICVNGDKNENKN